MTGNHNVSSTGWVTTNNLESDGTTSDSDAAGAINTTKDLLP